MFPVFRSNAQALPLQLLPVISPSTIPTSPAGYRQSRSDVLAHLESNKIDNTIVLTGKSAQPQTVFSQGSGGKLERHDQVHDLTVEGAC